MKEKLGKQSIEVHFLNRNNPCESLYHCSTQATSHQEAIEIALSAWSGVDSKIQRLERVKEVEQGMWVPESPSWPYYYIAVQKTEQYRRVLMVLVLAQYQEEEKRVY